MPSIVDYASLSQAIVDFSHNTLLGGTSTTGAYTDYFIQGAQEQIQNDIFSLNFGNGIRLQEAPYPATNIVDGVAPVPSDWLAPKLITVSDGDSDEFTLIFKAAAWIYDNYPIRQPEGLPAYIARDVASQAFYSLTFTTSTSSSFSIAGAPSAIPSYVVLDGAILSPTDYSIAGSTLNLNFTPASGQTLYVQWGGFATSSYLTFNTTADQTSFSLAAAPTSSPVLVALDGAALVPGDDYTISGSTLTLSFGALANQTLYCQYESGPQASATSQFVFGPYPDSDYQIQGTYYQAAQLLSAANPTNWMVLSAPLMLHAACMIECGKFLIDDTMIQRWTPQYQARLKALVDADKAERWSASTMQVEVG